jgi:1-acyl-sn-glycerol-3-phosphate acyltransferase
MPTAARATTRAIKSKTAEEIEPSFVVAVMNEAIDEIDDTMAVNFSLEKFHSVRFTISKRISLFFEHTFPFFVQSMFVPVFFFIYKTCFVIKIHGKDNLRGVVADGGEKMPILFISNHIAWYDCFIFDMFVHPFSHILPFRFMGTRRFLVPFLALLKCIGVIDLVYFLFGVFRITPGEGAEKSLKKAYEIIKNDGTVVMYPEGRIWHPTNVHPEEIGPFKWGAAILAKNTGVQVVPVSFRRTVRADKHGFAKARLQLDVTIGKPYYVDPTKAPEVIADDMRGKVEGLFNGMK